MKTREKIDEYKDNADVLRQFVQEVNSYDGTLESYEWQEFDDDFFDTYFSGKPDEAARAVFFGEIQNWMDEYIRFNAYGNLESANDFTVDKELIEGADEILDRVAELVDEGNIDIEWILEHN